MRASCSPRGRAGWARSCEKAWEKPCIEKATSFLPSFLMLLGASTVLGGCLPKASSKGDTGTPEADADTETDTDTDTQE